MLLLVPSDLSNSLIKALQYGKIVCHFYRYTRNILTKETATGYQPVTSCRVWEVYHIFINTNFQSPVPGSEFGRLFNSTMNRPWNLEPFGSQGWGLKITKEEHHLKLPNSAWCYRCVSGCCFFCQNIPSVSVGVANNFTIL